MGAQKVQNEINIYKCKKQMRHQWAVENNVYPLDNRGWGAKIKTSVQ